MATLSYHWDFTSTNNSTLSDGDEISEENDSSLKAKIVVHDASNLVSGSGATRDSDGITFVNNYDPSAAISTNGGYYIDLVGLDLEEFGGDISVEMVIKNTTSNVESMYFMSRDGSGSTLKPHIELKYTSDNKIKMATRGNEENIRATSSAANIIDQSNFYHYVFTISNETESDDNIQIYVNKVEEYDSSSHTETLMRSANKSVVLDTLTTDTRSVNFIGAAQNASTRYINGTIKYFKIWDGVLSFDQILTQFKNLTNSPDSWEDLSESASDSDKFTRRHTNVDDYFEANSTISTFTTTGSQLGLSNSSAQYTVHKFTNEMNIDTSSGNHYIPLKGNGAFVILKFGTTYIKITQTSVDNSTSTTYKYAISTDSGNQYGSEVTGNTFGDSFTEGNITVVFGGVETSVGSGSSSSSGTSSSSICFHEDTLIKTDQGLIKVKSLTANHTINRSKIVFLLKSKNLAKRLVLIKKNAFGINKPNRDVKLTETHEIMFNNESKFIKEFVNNNTIRYIDNTIRKNYVYNILMINKKFINVSNLNLGVINISKKKFKRLDNIMKNKNTRSVTLNLESNVSNSVKNKIKILTDNYLRFNQ